MADRLAIYNEALAHLGSRRLASLTENRAPRRELDAAWTQQVRYCLERAPWSQATRSVLLTYDPGIEPGFGPRYAFQKPDDWLKTVEIARDADFREPLRNWVDADGYWYADIDAIYVRFVSLDPAYGLNVTAWSPSFAAYVAVRLAVITCKPITGSEEQRNNLLKLERDARQNAKSADAMNTPPAFPPVGDWVRTRLSGLGTRRDFGTGTGGLV